MNDHTDDIIKMEAIWKRKADKMTVAIKSVKDRVKRKLKVVEEKHTEWDTFQESAVYIISTMSDVAEHKEAGNNNLLDAYKEPPIQCHLVYAGNLRLPNRIGSPPGPMSLFSVKSGPIL